MTEVERLILHNQYTILSYLDPQYAPGYYYPCLEALSGDGKMWNEHDIPNIVMALHKPGKALKLMPVSDDQQV